MKITILTLFPKMIAGFIEESIIKRAQDKNLVEIEVADLRSFAKDSYGSVDDKPYGGGAGMVMRVDVLHDALTKIKEQSAKSKDVKVILTSAKGRTFNQKKAEELLKLEHLVILAGHYEGVDERIMQEIDEEISLGDFVMTGGEIPAASIVDAVVRLIPGVLEKESATKEESFFEVDIDELLRLIGDDKKLKGLQEKGLKTVRLLEYPHYTRPEEFQGKEVPEVLLSGDHKKIQEWRLKKAYEETVKKRPDLLS